MTLGAGIAHILLRTNYKNDNNFAIYIVLRMIDQMELCPTVFHVAQHLKFKMADMKPEVDTYPLLF